MPPEEMNLAVFDPFKALAVKVQEEDAALQIDHTTLDGEKELRSWVRTVRGYRAGLEKIRVRAKENSLEYGRSVDKLAKELKSPFDTIIDARMKPLDEIENAKRAKAEAIVEAEQKAAEKVEADKLADLKRREAEVARKEAEIKVAEDAANAEQQAADRVVRERHIAAVAAESARITAEEKAKREDEEKEQARLDEIEDKAAVERMDAEVVRRRVADVEHREDVERDIAQAIVDECLHLSPDHAELVLTALKDGKIPNVTINY